MNFDRFSSNEIQYSFWDWFEITRNGLETDYGMARNGSDSLGMNFNPILSSGLSTFVCLSKIKSEQMRHRFKSIQTSHWFKSHFQLELITNIPWTEWFRFSRSENSVWINPRLDWIGLKTWFGYILSESELFQAIPGSIFEPFRDTSNKSENRFESRLMKNGQKPI